VGLEPLVLVVKKKENWREKIILSKKLNLIINP